MIYNKPYHFRKISKKKLSKLNKQMEADIYEAQLGILDIKHKSKSKNNGNEFETEVQEGEDLRITETFPKSVGFIVGNEFCER